MSFNPEAELRTLAEADARRGGRKLAFRLQCAAFAALYEGVAPKVVGFAFKISPQTVSYISGCLENDPDPYRRETVEAATDPARPHRVELVQRVLAHDHNDRRNPNRYRRYENVAREFEALGKEEFLRRYMTPGIIDQLAAARKRLATNNPRPFNPRDTPLDEDGDPVFEKMTDKQIMQWRRENPTRYRALFPDHFANGNEGFFGEADK